jgi:hypothetical protein
MTFHVVLLSEEQSTQIPPVSKVLLDRAGPALLLNARRPPIVLFCDAVTGEFPGFHIGEQVFLLNDVAWKTCEGLNLHAIKTIDDSEIPKKYGLLIGPASASYKERRFE